MTMAKWEDPEDRVTDEGCWRRSDDNRFPNPTIDLKKTVSEQREEIAAAQNHDTKIIMAHEFRENPEGFQAMAHAIADSYNEQHSLKVGEELPEQLRKEEDNG
jgi:hypothetical protein